MKLLKISLTLAFISLLTSCSTLNIYPKKTTKEFPLKIGLVADSQITTQKGAFDYGMRKKVADKFVNVAIRPAAIEYLAPGMLKYFLQELRHNEVDAILYLGDGANSGCKDELDTLFNILGNFRNRHQIPIYYTIGNHDYLGAGNQTMMSMRENLCDNGFNNNPPETKHQVLRRIKKFNLGNKRIEKNFSYNEVYWMPKDLLIGQSYDKSHLYSYYGAILKHKSKKGVDIELLLTDTSDYANVVFKDHELWGVKAGLSYQENKYKIFPQINNFLKHSDKKVDYRLIASHYQPTKTMTPSLVRDDLIKLLHGKNNYWLSGHSHTKKPEIHKRSVGKIFRKKEKFLEFNVGSTTDYFPHVAILEANSGFNYSIDDHLGYRVIRYKDDKVTCSKILGYAQKNRHLFYKVSQKNEIERMLGLDKSYRDDHWSSVDIKRVRLNIDKLMSVRKDISQKITKHDMISCLTMKAARNERSFWDKFKEFFGK